jgi:hypothetical protein
MMIVQLVHQVEPRALSPCIVKFSSLAQLVWYKF